MIIFEKNCERNRLEDKLSFAYSTNPNFKPSSEDEFVENPTSIPAGSEDNVG